VANVENIKVTQVTHNFLCGWSAGGNLESALDFFKPSEVPEDIQVLWDAAQTQQYKFQSTLQLIYDKIQEGS
jgi:hypothetical protein